MFRSLYSRPYLLLSLTSLFWAGNAVVGRAVVGIVPPVALSQFRWCAAFLLVLPFAWPHLREEFGIVRRHLGLLTLMAFAGITAFNTMLYWSLQYTTAINATLMQSSGPLMIGLWSFVLFRDPLTRRQLAGILISLCGVAAIVSGGDPARLARLTLNIGDLVIIAAIAVYALYSTLLRKRPGVSALSFLAVTIGIGALLLVPLTVVEHLAGGRFAPLNAGAVAALAYVSLFPSVVAYLCYNRGVQLIGANRSGPFLHLVPLFGALLAIVFLGERPGIHHALGAVLIVGGVVLASRKPGVGNRVAGETDRV